MLESVVIELDTFIIGLEDAVVSLQLLRPYLVGKKFSFFSIHTF